MPTARFPTVRPCLIVHRFEQVKGRRSKFNKFEYVWGETGALCRGVDWGWGPVRGKGWMASLKAFEFFRN